MMIVEAIRSASNEHAVYFLVTAYIESLRHFARTSGVPAETLELPIRGAGDIAARLSTLCRHTVPLEAIVPVSELAAVLTCAIERVADATPAEPLMSRARSDTPHSALSV